MAELEELPLNGKNTPEYVAVRRSSRLIGGAIEAIRDDFVGEAFSCGLIPSLTPRDPVMEVVLADVCSDPVNYYVLQYVLATLNGGNRFNESINSMKSIYLGKESKLY